MLRSVFARAYGFSLGKAGGATREERARSVWELAVGRPVEALHVWQRATAVAGVDGYEQGVTPLAREVEDLIRGFGPEAFHAARSTGSAEQRFIEPASAEAAEPVARGVGARRGATSGSARPPLTPPCEGGELILDCVIVEEDEWWVGFHRVNSVVSSWPGGLMPGSLPPLAVSRGYLKLQEALLWSGLPLKAGQQCVEIGSAPGGATQVLLERGLRVTGIDPAAMHPAVLANKKFTHIRRRSKDVRRREFVGCDWLVADINLPPNYTLDTLEAILSHPEVRFRGVVLTLKLREWTLANQVPEYLARVRSWGFSDVQARQLHHNRQEICVVGRKLGTKSRRESS